MGSIGQDFAKIYGRELDRLADEIAAYRIDEELWSTMGAQKNPPGALALHAVGALMGVIGSGLGGTGYLRDRDREFTERNVPRDQIVQRIRECRDTIVSVLDGLDDAAMSDTYPGKTPPSRQGITTQGYLMHLLWHLGWHQGHIYYHRLGILEPGEV